MLRAVREGGLLRRARARRRAAIPLRLPLIAMVDPQPSNVDAVIRDFQAPLRDFVARRVASPADVDDVLQEVLIRIAQSADGLGRVGHVRGWVHRVARNVLIDHFRARGRAPTDEVPDLADEGPEEGGTADHRRALAGCLSPIIDLLEPPYREAIRLTEIEGLTQAEAARRAGLSVSGMKSRVQRGREQLRKLVLTCCEVDLDRRGGITRFQRRPNGCGCSST